MTRSEALAEARRRYYPTYRQFTGTPYLYRAYVMDRSTGSVAVACPHRHRTRRTNRYNAEGRIVINGSIPAEKCAARLLRRSIPDLAWDILAHAEAAFADADHRAKDA